MIIGAVNKGIHVTNNVFQDDDFLKVYDRVLPYAKHYKKIMTLHLEVLKESHRVADLGCGTGNLTIKFLEQGKIITGIDQSKKSLEKLRKKIKQCNYEATLIEADISNLFQLGSKTYDGVSSMITAHLLEDFSNHINEAHRILKPGGTFVITARRKGGNQEALVRILRSSLIESKKFNSLQDDFNILSSRLLQTANGRSPSLKSIHQAVDELKQAGFKSITKHKNNSRGVMYTLSGIR